MQVGDSIVSKARETLERAIHLVEATPCWGAQVVYGDTDSLFVWVPGKSREQAFKIGAEIAEAITLDNPKPVKLKLEKVYQPCILQVRISGFEECKFVSNVGVCKFSVLGIWSPHIAVWSCGRTCKHDLTFIILAHQMWCGHLNPQVTKAPYVLRCGHLKAPYIRVEA